MGVWIETNLDLYNGIATIVTPHVGVWIETTVNPYTSLMMLSLPMWECGLKLDG